MMDSVLKIVRTQLMFGVPVLETPIGYNGPQAVRIPADVPRTCLRVVFALDTAVNVQNCQRFCIGQRRRFNRLH